MTKVFVVSFDGVDTGRRIIGVATSYTNVPGMIDADFVKHQNYKDFKVVVDSMARISVEDGATTTTYQIVERDDKEYETGDCYLVQETWLYP